MLSRVGNGKSSITFDSGFPKIVVKFIWTDAGMRTNMAICG